MLCQKQVSSSFPQWEFLGKKNPPSGDGEGGFWISGLLRFFGLKSHTEGKMIDPV